MTGPKQRSGPSRRQRRDTRLQRRLQRRERIVARWEASRRARQRRLAELRQRLGLRPERAYWGITLARQEIADAAPWWRALKDFVFGPPAEAEPADAELSNVLTYIREHEGRITSAEIVALTGRTLEQAGALALQLIVRYEGDVTVSDDGILVYTFDRLATTASADEAALGWIRDRGGVVSVSELARHEGISAAAALQRLEDLARRFAGEAEHGESSRFRFDVEGAGPRGRDGARGSSNATYAWERLERSPVILGGSLFQRRAIIGLNLLNVTVSSGLIGYYARGNLLLGQPWEPLLLGYIPLVYAALVFVIPLARLLARWVADEGRLRRNARRVLLLGLFNRLVESDTVTAADLERELFGRASIARPRQMVREMDRLARDYGGDIDVAASPAKHGYAYVFDRMHRELAGVEQERMAVDLDSLRVGRIVYDSGSDDG